LIKCLFVDFKFIEILDKFNYYRTNSTLSTDNFEYTFGENVIEVPKMEYKIKILKKISKKFKEKKKFVKEENKKDVNIEENGTKYCLKDYSNDYVKFSTINEEEKCTNNFNKPFRFCLDEGDKLKKPFYFLVNYTEKLPDTTISLCYYDQEKNNWKRESNKVYRRANSNELLVKIKHFSSYRFEEDVNYFKIDHALINDEFSREWKVEMKNTPYKKGGKDYYVPIKWKRIGLQVDNFDQNYENWCVGFHGCPPEKLQSILRIGLSHRGFTNAVETPSGHIQKANHPAGLRPEIDFEGKFWKDAIFLSPSYIYSTFYSSNASIKNLIKFEHIWFNVPIINNKIKAILLQVRVNPKSIKEYKETIGAQKKIDKHYDNSKLEWRIVDPKNVKVIWCFSKRI
jgi:hypothetical protein